MDSEVGGGHSFHGQTKPNLVSYPSSRLKEEKSATHAVYTLLCTRGEYSSREKICQNTIMTKIREN